MLQRYFILIFSRDHVLTKLHLAPIFATVNRRVTRHVKLHKYLYIQWNPNFSNPLEKLKLVRNIEGGTKSLLIYEGIVF